MEYYWTSRQRPKRTQKADLPSSGVGVQPKLQRCSENVPDIAQSLVLLRYRLEERIPIIFEEGRKTWYNGIPRTLCSFICRRRRTERLVVVECLPRPANLDLRDKWLILVDANRFPFLGKSHHARANLSMPVSHYHSLCYAFQLWSLQFQRG